jgi:hypothetical protein
MLWEGSRVVLVGTLKTEGPNHLHLHLEMSTLKVTHPQEGVVDQEKPHPYMGRVAEAIMIVLLLTVIWKV